MNSHCCDAFRDAVEPRQRPYLPGRPAIVEGEGQETFRLAFHENTVGLPDLCFCPWCGESLHERIDLVISVAAEPEGLAEKLRRRFLTAGITATADVAPRPAHQPYVPTVRVRTRKLDVPNVEPIVQEELARHENR